MLIVALKIDLNLSRFAVLPCDTPAQQSDWGEVAEKKQEFFLGRLTIPSGPFLSNYIGSHLASPRGMALEILKSNHFIFLEEETWGKWGAQPPFKNPQKINNEEINASQYEHFILKF